MLHCIQKDKLKWREGFILIISVNEDRVWFVLSPYAPPPPHQNLNTSLNKKYPFNLTTTCLRFPADKRSH